MTDEERAQRVEEIRRLAAQPVVELWADEHVRRLLSELDRVTAERDAALAQVAKLRDTIHDALKLLETGKPSDVGMAEDDLREALSETATEPKP